MSERIGLLRLGTMLAARGAALMGLPPVNVSRGGPKPRKVYPKYGERETNRRQRQLANGQIRVN